MLERLRKLAEEGRFGKSIIEVNACVGVPLSRKSKLVIQLFIGVNGHAKSGGVERQTDVEIFGLKLHYPRLIARSEGKKSEIAASHGIDRFRIFSYSKSRAEGKSLSELCAKISDY